MKRIFFIGKILRDHGKLLISHETAEFSVVTREAPGSGHAYETAVKYKRTTVNGREWTVLARYDDTRAAVAGHNRLVKTLAQPDIFA